MLFIDWANRAQRLRIISSDTQRNFTDFFSQIMRSLLNCNCYSVITVLHALNAKLSTTKVYNGMNELN